MNEKKKKYKSLLDELEKGETKLVPLQYVCEDKAKKIEEDLEKEAEMKDKIKDMPNPYRFAGYDPNVIDFIRRCDKEEQAIEIINYLEKKNEITEEEAKNLKNQLIKKGLRSFGEKKEEGFYFKNM